MAWPAGPIGGGCELVRPGYHSGTMSEMSKCLCMAVIHMALFLAHINGTARHRRAEWASAEAGGGIRDERT